MPSVLEFLHLFFAFGYVGTLVVAEWNGRAARATEDWSQRSTLFQVIFLSSRVGGGGLFLTGILGHGYAVPMGWSMGRDPWMWTVTVVWIAALLSIYLVNVPKARELATIARTAAAGGSSEGWASALARWRFGNVLQSGLYLSLLALMVFRWRTS
jgi:hypothetical protein